MTTFNLGEQTHPFDDTLQGSSIMGCPFTYLGVYECGWRVKKIRIQLDIVLQLVLIICSQSPLDYIIIKFFLEDQTLT